MSEIECYTFENEIEADIHLVFECLNRDKHVLKWNTQLIENIYEGSESDMKEGSAFITRQKIDKKVYELKGIYSKYNPPYHAIVETETKEGKSKTEYTLKEYSEGTLFTVRVTLVPSNWFYKTAAKLLKWSFKFIYDDQFKRFIEYVYQVEYDRDVKRVSNHKY
ncbi:SRPBCC family protein [Bacillus infantis]|uniref:SRPBCC family protein n=1 Tax=Bacillus infantis TaxID=324767 RepID=UPI003CF19245